MSSGQVREKHLIVKKLTVAGRDVTGGIVLSSGQTVDINGIAGGLVLDADADTHIGANTDDVIVFTVANAADFHMLANVFRALSGSSIETNTINETTSAAGVTIDGVLVKDGTAHAGRASQELTETGAITINSGLVKLNHATVVIEATIDAPAVGDELFIVNTSASGDAAHTVTFTGQTIDATGNDTATLDAPEEALHLIALSATRWLIVQNIGSVGLSGA